MNKSASKYRNHKYGEFDSKKEAMRYAILSALESEGVIRDLQRQVTFLLIPSQKGADGKVIERPCTYKADFTYYQGDEFIVEDSKGFKTKDYKIKKKLMLYIHGIRVKET